MCYRQVAAAYSNHMSKQEQSETTPMSAKENLVWFRSPYPDPQSDYLQNLTVTSLSRDTSTVKCFMKIRLLSPEISAKLWKNALSRNVEESVKKFLDPDPEADDFQNLNSFSLCTDTFVVKCSRRSVE